MVSRADVANTTPINAVFPKRERSVANRRRSNAKSAKIFRDKRKQHLADLERQVVEMREQIDRLNKLIVIKYDDSVVHAEFRSLISDYSASTLRLTEYLRIEKDKNFTLAIEMARLRKKMATTGRMATADSDSTDSDTDAPQLQAHVTTLRDLRPLPFSSLSKPVVTSIDDMDFEESDNAFPPAPPSARLWDDDCFGSDHIGVIVDSAECSTNAVYDFSGVYPPSVMT
jgi:hypothetical protein